MDKKWTILYYDFFWTSFNIVILAANFLFAQNLAEINLTNTVGDDGHPFFSPNGSKVVFESNRDGNWEIYIMDSDDNNQKNQTKNAADDRMPS